MIAAVLAGAAAGLLSGWGLGGGTLLLLFLSLWGNLDQLTAQGVNLLYFLPCAAVALRAHIRQYLVEKTVVLPAILTGLAGTALGAFLATCLDVRLLRRGFGAFLLGLGVLMLVQQLRRKKQAQKNPAPPKKSSAQNAEKSTKTTKKRP